MHQVEELKWEKGGLDAVAKPLGVMITGDLTAYAHENQIQEYRKPLGAKPAAFSGAFAKDLGDQR